MSLPRTPSIAVPGSPVAPAPPTPVAAATTAGTQVGWTADLAVVESIFHASIPVAFVVDGAPAPVYVNAPRNSYLHIVLASVPYLGTLDVFAKAAGGQGGGNAVDVGAIPDLVFRDDVSGSLIRWHFPIGLLADLRALPHPLDADERRKVPWRIRVSVNRDENLDSALGLPYPGIDGLEAMFTNTVKEAEFMRYGSVKKIMSLPKDTSEQLWRAVVDNNLSTGEPVINTLFHTDPVARAWPIRVYPPAAAGPSAPPYFQLFLPPAEYSTVADLLAHPRVAAATDLGPPPTAVVHGLAVHPDTPLSWVYRHLVTVDGWIHLVLHPAAATSSPPAP
ncbi:autophagy protein 5 [Blastocladiella emersonii ATCC 22665]|nr:autophagy protein 5 [Blastocladiella emersonii ATCC 22665]